MEQSVWHVVETTCAIVGAWVLLAALVATVWTVVVGRDRGMRLERAALPVEEVSVASQGADQPGERRAQTWADVPGWVARDREWAVAVVLLGAPTVADGTHPFVDFPSRTIDWPGLLVEASSWAEEDRLLVYTAYDLASDSRDAKGDRLGGDHVTLAQMVGLDHDVADRLQAAVDVRRGRCDYLTAVVRAGGLG